MTTIIPLSPVYLEQYSAWEIFLQSRLHFTSEILDIYPLHGLISFGTFLDSFPASLLPKISRTYEKDNRFPLQILDSNPFVSFGLIVSNASQIYSYL